MKSKIPNLTMNTKFVKSATKVEELPKDSRPQIAMVGRSNVGKSSLLNSLTNSGKMARVSSEPGRTQTLNIFDVDGRYYLVDLPGYGYAKTSKEKREDISTMIEDYIWKTSVLKLVLLIVDARTGPTELDLIMMSILHGDHTPFIIILNKIDKLSQSEKAKAMQRIETDYPQIKYIPHSNVTGKGRGEILQEIDQAIRQG